MPIRPPALDDRGFDDLVAELIARIPAHTPEWTNPRIGDPGRTLLELFAWLGDTILYRANLIPERQRLAFLRLLGVPLRPAVAARTIVTVRIDDDAATDAVSLRPGAALDGPVPFETDAGITVLPVGGAVYCKRTLTESESNQFADVVPELQSLYGIGTLPTPYVTTPVFDGGAPDEAGFDLVRDTIDGSLWVALLAGTDADREAVRRTLGGSGGRQRILNVGVVPALEVPALFEDIGPRARVPHVWELSTGREIGGEPEYLTLDVVEDGTQGLTERGVVRLVLPAARHINAPSNDVRRSLQAGVGDRPPRLDTPDAEARLVAWLRLRPAAPLDHLALSWVGINAVSIAQIRTLDARLLGISDGAGEQVHVLPRDPGETVEAASLRIQVEETGAGFREWRREEELATARRDDAVYVLDAEAGTIRFGDGVRGRVPDAGARIRAESMRAGGGARGNLPAGTLQEIRGVDLDGAPVPGLKVEQPLPAIGGEDAETLERAERRIPDLFRHRSRAVTESDFRVLAGETPGVRVGRVEVLPRFKPHQRRFDVPGVVSVLALPGRDDVQPPNPRPDRPFIEAVHAYLDARRPLATELYVIGCEYVALGLGVALGVRDGADREGVIHDVREALRRFLWPLPPGGTQASGWPLGGPVRDRELEVIIAQVAGVRSVAGVNLFERDGEDWRAIPRANAAAPVELALEAWQLPELLGLVVVAGDEVPTDLRAAPNPFARASVGVPVVPEVC